ncbi:N-acetylmuramoyl-L-alanine amidase [Candidatus Saccharibacteria bacterium]|jgi:N-acetyl-anhydromuramyl-L-alanine amidase AmpD|nr:N-acetylmuramoyl-L-alanine amidase [Candidatus Saccharibacteria bacterium]MBP9131836.1 N-acetylmuramoyl-L-alanine amidase [Candidatus Saccharibacteria bacterium]
MKSYKLVSHPSPNFSSRNGRSIEKIIIHHTNVSEEGSLLALTRKSKIWKRVSAHYMVSNDGETVYQLVDDRYCAWHAGYENIDSIGIEHVSKRQKPLSDNGYNSSALLIAELCKIHNLKPLSAVEPHYVTDRKTVCPSEVDWKLIRSLAARILETNE